MLLLALFGADPLDRLLVLRLVQALVEACNGAQGVQTGAGPCSGWAPGLGVAARKRTPGHPWCQQCVGLSDMDTRLVSAAWRNRFRLTRLPSIYTLCRQPATVLTI